MQDDSWKAELKGPTRILQIICTAMIVGCLVLTGVVLSMVLSGSMPTSDTAPLLTYVGAGAAFLLLLLRAIIPEIVAARGRRAIAAGTWEPSQTPAARSNPRSAELIERTGDAGRLMAVYTLRGIIAMALLEGGCFMNLVIYMLDQEPLSLGVAGGLLAALAIGFPTHERVVAWVEQQLRDLGQQGHF